MRLFPLLVVLAFAVPACNKSGDEAKPDDNTGQQAKADPAPADTDPATDKADAATTDKDVDSDEATGESKGTGNGEAAAANKDTDTDESTGESHDKDGDSDEATGEGSGKGMAAGTAGESSGKGPPKNLKVLPKSWKRKRVVKEMKEWNRGLGVKCKFCHDVKDYASDKNKHKIISREMVIMQKRLNKQYFGGKPKVSCYTCHQGKAHPAK